MLKLMLLSRTVFSLTREMYLAGCELHIQSFIANRSYLRINISTPKLSEEMKSETSIALTIIASLSQLTRPESLHTLRVFPGRRVVLEPSLHFNLSPHFNPSLQSKVCVLQ